MSYDIATIPGDGIGPDVTAAALAVLSAAGEYFGFGSRVVQFGWGCDHFVRTGEMMPHDALARLADFDAIFLGCVGDASKVPDHVSLTLLLTIRQAFDQYVNLRPIRLRCGVPTLIRTATSETVDLVVVRENTEGEYAAVGGVLRAGSPEAMALQTSVFTRRGCERVIRYAFDLARRRAAASGRDRSPMVTNCTKSNALTHSMVFWDGVYDEVASRYPDVRTDSALVDALTARLIKEPQAFDVIVASNLFGDIITDLGAMLQGGMGVAASGNINPEGTHPSMFEPVHGSAPDLVGRGVANPIAAIAAVAMLLEHLGEAEAAAGIEDAITTALERPGVRPCDLGGRASTTETAEAIRDVLLDR